MANIDHRLFRQLDLNLLVAFDALISEASVSRAAARLYIGQPAMSHALARLREVFQDEILYREGQGMRPTTRALALAPRVRELLLAAQALARDDLPFDPALASGTFRVALNDPLEALLLPGLVARLRHKAPGLKLSVRPIPASLQLEHLERGGIQLCIGYFPQLRDCHESRLLLRSRFCSVHNPALLDLTDPPTLADLLQYPHIHTSYTGDAPGLVDKFLGERGQSREVVAQAAVPLAIPFVVKHSPLLAILPELITRLFAAHDDLRIRPLAVDGLELPISLVIHRRDRGDPLTRFVADEAQAAASELFGQPEPLA